MIVSDIMTRNVVAIALATPVAQAIGLMVDHTVSGLPVLDAQGRIVGILTEGDLLRRVETGTAAGATGWLGRLFQSGNQARDYIATHGRLASEVMTAAVTTIAADATLAEAVGLMQRHHVKRLPVTHDGKLVGILSRRDVMRQVGAVLSEVVEPAADAALEQTIVAAIARQPWAGRYAARVTVKDGQVALDGCLFDLDARAALTVLAENVPGVKGVDNRLVCVEPMSGMVLYDPALGAGAGAAL